MRKTKEQCAEIGAPSLRAYLAPAMHERIGRMLMHVEGVRDGREPAAVHQMRVWSRRTRAALDVASCCVRAVGGKGEKRLRALSREVKQVTRALGHVRDLDVMVEALERLAEPLPAERREGVAGLVARLRRDRQELQNSAAAAAKRFERSDPLGAHREIVAGKDRRGTARAEANGAATGDDAGRGATGMEALAADSPAEGDSAAAIGPGTPALEAAEQVISARLDALLAFEPYIEQPDRVSELHAMRIAAKRLRYSMELFEDLYRDRTAHGAAFSAGIREVKQMQERLGAIHDADVLVPRLVAEIASLLEPGHGVGEAGQPVAGVHLVDFDACQGLLTICAEARDRRDAEFESFARDWRGHRDRRAFDALRDLLRAACAPDDVVAPSDGKAREGATP